MDYNKDRFPSEESKVIFGISYLEGNAFAFIEIFLDNWRENAYNPDELRNDMNQIFKSFKHF